MFADVCKIYRKTSVSESFFNRVADLYPPTFLKEKTPMQVYSDEFREIFMTPFSRNTSRQLLLFYGVIFTNKIKRALWKKDKESKLLVRKTTTHAKKLTYCLHQVYISFYYSSISLFFFSATHDTSKARVFRTNAKPKFNARKYSEKYNN